MDKRIKKVLDYVEDNLKLPLDLDHLADIACLSPSQFHRMFRKETFSTPFKFIESIKVNKAYHCLLYEDAMVYELATNLGYNDYETFSRAFKKHFHLSPDDLKSIASKVKESMQGTEDEFLVVTMDTDENQEGLIGHLKQVMVEKNISHEELKSARVYKITTKSNNRLPAKILIKNKYEMVQDQKIWESLLENKKT